MLPIKILKKNNKKIAMFFYNCASSAKSRAGMVSTSGHASNKDLKKKKKNPGEKIK